MKTRSQGILVIPSQFDPAKYERMIWGLILILMCIFRPQGLLPYKRKIAVWRKKIGHYHPPG
ncbi:MAG: hypothetical protein GX425_14120 [Peptococcaceae bacterium]|nr:hypothetical protein [Peptococcaceae bacterium]